MRFGILVSLVLGLVAVGNGCATRGATAISRVSGDQSPPPVSGVWQGNLHETVMEGAAAGDSREEAQEWHLDQVGQAVSGYYLATLTYTSGDGRPYVCNHAPRFSALIRIEVSGRMRGDTIDLEEVGRRESGGRCTVDPRPLARYRATVAGDVLMLVSEGTELELRRDRQTERAVEASAAKLKGGKLLATAEPVAATRVTGGQSAGASGGRPPAFSSALSEGARTPGISASAEPADVSGVWIWEHRASIPTGDEKQEREEWHVEQRGERISGYYDRVVKEISTDGHAFKCSMGLEFEIATRYRIRGEVRGNQVSIFESSFEVLDPSACDDGQRRLDAYQGQAEGDEVSLALGVGTQVLRRPRPDVPTQHF